MEKEKRINLDDPTIQIRIIKALDDIKPFGVFKNFYMVKAIRNLKQPNAIAAKNIWSFIENEYDIVSLDNIKNIKFNNLVTTFDEILDF